MPPIARLYWLIALVLMPLSAVWLFITSGADLAWSGLACAPVQFTIFLVLLAWALAGGYEIFFSVSNLRRNYPVLANIRYLLEYIRPEIQQYFIANNVEEKPFSRERRNLIYRRAKGANDTLPFGTEQDILAEGYRSLLHSMKPGKIADESIRVTFGGPECTNLQRFTAKYICHELRLTQRTCY